MMTSELFHRVRLPKKDASKGLRMKQRSVIRKFHLAFV